MKPYGNKRIENITCDYGCCTLGTVKTHRRSGVPKRTIRRARKRARQQSRSVITAEIAV